MTQADWIEDQELQDRTYGNLVFFPHAHRMFLATRNDGETPKAWFERLGMQHWATWANYLSREWSEEF